MGNYNDIYMRAYLGDPGNVPRSTSQPLSGSPDLISYGSQPVNKVSDFLTDASWGQAYDAETVVGLDNYMYIRAQNLGADEITGTFSLFSSPGDLLLWPSTWVQNQLKTQTGAKEQTLTLAANEKGVLKDAFVYRPTDLTHRCLVGMVGTPLHPAIIPPDGNIQDFAKWIAQNGNFAWHNLRVTSVGKPQWTKTTHYEQKEKESYVSFDLVCKGFPIGDSLEISCGVSGPVPPIALKKFTATQANFTIGVESLVPKGFSADISYSYYAKDPNAPPPPGFSVTFRASIFDDGAQSYSDVIYQHASTLEELGIPTPEVYIEQMKAVQKWSNLPWSTHEAYAEYLLRVHTHAKTYKVNEDPVKRFSVGTDSVYAQSISQF